MKLKGEGGTEVRAKEQKKIATNWTRLSLIKKSNSFTNGFKRIGCYSRRLLCAERLAQFAAAYAQRAVAQSTWPLRSLRPPEAQRSHGYTQKRMHARCSPRTKEAIAH
eukprot:5567290-Pleurochrysis_carterae.AAC.1